MQKTENATLDKLEGVAQIQKNRINEILNEDVERLNGLITNDDLKKLYLRYMEFKNPDDLLQIENIMTDTLFSDNNFDRVVLFYNDGNVVASVQKTDQNENDPPMFFPENTQKREIHIINDNGDSHLYFSGPILLNDEIIGWVSITTDLKDVVRVLQDYSGLGTTGETVLAERDVNGNALFISPLRFDKDAAFSREVTSDQVNSPIVQSLTNPSVRMKEAIDYRGEKVLAATKYLENTDWGLVSKIDKSEVYTSFYEANIIQLGLIIILVGVMTSLSLVISNRILKPIIRLKDVVLQIEKGNYNSELIPSGKNELSSLIEAFSSLQNSLKKHEEENKVYQKKLRTQLKQKNDLHNALDNSSIVSIIDKEGTIIFVNKKFEEISKYSANELIGKNHTAFNSGFHPPEFYDNLWNTISSGKVWQGNIQNQAKDNSIYWTRTTITPFLDEDGKPEQFIAVRTDITELMVQKELIQSQFKELREVDVRKEEFASMVSHELKTPITPIKFNTEMLLEPGVLGPLTRDQEEAIKEIEINTLRLENLISDILYAQRLDMNRMVFNKNKFFTGDLLSKVSKNLSSLMEEKQIEFIVKDEFTGIINSDEGRIQQILENLIKNSIDFVPNKGGKISMGTRNYNEFVIFYVIDNGIGIPEEKQKGLFKKFYQVDTSHTRKHGGTGLGLVISKGFAEGLGGKIWCESKHGEGTGFYFTIPKNQEIEVKTSG